MLEGCDLYLEAIAKFRAKEMGFREFSGWVRLNSIGEKLDYDGDWYSAMEHWMEEIEYECPEDEWYELGCSAADFLEDAIMNEPRPIELPKNDRIIRWYLGLEPKGDRNLLFALAKYFYLSFRDYLSFRKKLLR